MFRLIIFTLIGLFAVVILRTTPEIASGWNAPVVVAQPRGAQLADRYAGDAVRTDGGHGEAVRDPAQLVFDRIGVTTHAPQAQHDAASTAGAGATGASQWIEIRDAAGRRSFISARNAVPPAPQ